TVFLDTSTLEPQDDQWAYLSSLGRLSPREVTRLAERLGSVTGGAAVKGLGQPTSTRTVPQAPPIVRARLAAGVTVQGEGPPPPRAPPLTHPAPMPNPLFYERQRRRASPWNVPRFLGSYDETL